MPYTPTRRETLAILVAASAGGQTASSSPTDWTLVQASEQVRRGKISPVELTRACLSRIEKLNPQVNAYITVMAEQSLAQARALEAELHAGKSRGPLHGIPIALKDLFDTAGVRTTCGSAVFADRIPSEDAEVVRRLKAAGTVVVAKANMHEFAYGATSIPSHYGAVHNPWNLDCIAGGSSGGSAAAVAAGMCFGAMGSDTGGSIREPASFCGLSGLKPTYGRVSVRGVVPLSWSLDHVGPICRTVADAALMLEAIARYDALDTNCVDWPVDHYAQAMHAKTAALKIGVVRRIFLDQVDAQVETAFRSALEVSGKLTTGVRDAELPSYKPLPLVAVEAYAYHMPYVTKTPELYQPTTLERLRVGPAVSASAYAEARRELDRLRRVVGTVFSSVDLLVTPTTPLVAVNLAEGAQQDRIPDTSPLLRNTRPFDVFGLPTISIPCGFTRDGLPIGLQISGPRFGESRVLALAHAYQQATDWHTRRPQV